MGVEVVVGGTAVVVVVRIGPSVEVVLDNVVVSVEGMTVAVVEVMTSTVVRGIVVVVEALVPVGSVLAGGAVRNGAQVGAHFQGWYLNGLC